MPELPEVEVVRRGLDAALVGHTFDAVEVLHPRAVRGNAVDLAAVLPGLTVTGTGRRGKFMWLELSDGAALLIHLRMSGQVLVTPPGQVESPHLRIRARMGDSEVSFVDQRTFGLWQYVALDDGIPESISHIAADPFDPAFDLTQTARAAEAQFRAEDRAAEPGGSQRDRLDLRGRGNVGRAPATVADRAHHAPARRGARPRGIPRGDGPRARAGRHQLRLALR